MIKTNYDEIRQAANLGDTRIEGTVHHAGEEYYILTDCVRQATDHILVGNAYFDKYVEFFNLVPATSREKGLKK